MVLHINNQYITPMIQYIHIYKSNYINRNRTASDTKVHSYYLIALNRQL